MHGLESLLKVTVVDNLSKRSNNVRFERKVHGEVRIAPITNNTHPSKIVALVGDLFCRIFPTLLPKLARAHLMTGLSDLFLDIELNRQSVTIPTGNIGRIESRECL